MNLWQQSHPRKSPFCGKCKKRRKNFRWIGIASSVLIVAGLVTYFSRNWNKQKGEATLPDAKINVWYVMDDADNMEESHKAKV